MSILRWVNSRAYSRFGSRAVIAAGVFGGLSLVVGFASSAAAQGSTCNAIAFISYPNPPPQNFQGTVDHVKLQIGSGPIDGGSELVVNQVFFDLSCRHMGCSEDLNKACTTSAQCTGICLTLLPGTCADDGSTPNTNTVIGYNNNLTTDCTTGPGVGQGSPVTFSAVVNAGNHVVFTASLPIHIGANTADFCHLFFDIIKTDSKSYDDTTTIIEERSGVESGQCDNGLAAAGQNTGSIIFSNTPTATATNSPTETPTNTPTNTPTSTFTSTPTLTPTPSNTPTLTLTPTDTPTLTPTLTPTPSNTPTLTFTRTPTLTPTNTPTPTLTPSPTVTSPPIPLIPTPTSPAGLLLIGGLGLSIAWMLTRAARASR